jgi:hypothetical protein
LDEDDIDGDGRRDDSLQELDIDDDGRTDDSPSELDIDGDNLTDDDPSESDVDGDGRRNGDPDEDDCDGDGRRRGKDLDDDGDGVDNRDDDDDDHDGLRDDDDDDDAGPGLPATQVGDGQAPTALTGLTYLVSEKGIQLPERLVFTTGTAGRQTDAVETDLFTYTYTPNGPNATLRLNFKTDKWDVYSLNFATGAFSRDEFDKNQKKDSDTGTFALPAP